MKIHPAERAARPSLQADDVLYVVRGVEFVKIGFTNDLARRVSELQVGSPHELEVLLAIPGSLEDEAWVHEKFRAWRVRGEWFAFTGALVDWVEAARHTRSVR